VFAAGSLTSPCALDLKLTRKPIRDLIPQYWASNWLPVMIGARPHGSRDRDTEEKGKKTDRYK
jgi:hypothetical protein